MKSTILSDYEIERQKPIPNQAHSFIQSNLIFQLNFKYRKQYQFFSELSLDLNPNEKGDVPDICIYPKMKVDTKADIIAMTEAPLCAIEILSPSQSFTEVYLKAAKYFRNGVKSCWIVLPGVDNIYVFKDADNYQIFKSKETLVDEILEISLLLQEVFE